MDDILITEQTAVDTVVEQMKNRDFSGAERVCVLVKKGVKGAISLENQINRKVEALIKEGNWPHSHLPKKNKTNI